MPVAPSPAPEARTGRTRLAAIAAVAALVLGSAAGLVVFLVRGDDPVDHSARGPDQVRAAPVDLAPRTAVVRARITASGDVKVQQWIRSASALFGIGLSPPPAAGAAAGPSPFKVRDVQVFANGDAAPGPERLKKEQAYYPFAAGTTDVFVSYHLVGAVERSGSVPGRALARVTALDVDVSPPLVATTYSVSGGDVLALACASEEPDAVPTPCGAPARRGWRVELRGAEPQRRGDRPARPALTRHWG